MSRSIGETGTTASSASKGTQILASLAVTLLVILSLWGILSHGFSYDVHQRIWRDIAARPSGPMSFRFYLQPAMAGLAALHDGITDARTGRMPNLHRLLTSSRLLRENLNEALRSTSRIILLALGMDAAYQATVFETFYPGEMVWVALLLALLPYVLLRGLIAAIARRWLAHKGPPRTMGG